jgi:hypothetical protein
MGWVDRDNPFAAPGRWFKGALHVHSTRSDGRLEPDELVQAYRERGFDFLCFADHNHVTRVASPADDFLVLAGIELGLNVYGADKYWHVVGIDADDAAATTERFDSPGAMVAHLADHSAFRILAHPYWSQLTGSDLARLDGVDAVELYNSGAELTVGRGLSDYPYDLLLHTGRRVPVVAADDCHAERELGSAWVMVKAETLSVETIIDALRSGRHYGSAGPGFRDVRIAGDRIEVETTPVRAIGFVAGGRKGARFEAEHGTTITQASYERRGDEPWVRVQCVDAEGQRAWTNPFYRENAV